MRISNSSREQAPLFDPHQKPSFAPDLIHNRFVGKRNREKRTSGGSKRNPLIYSILYVTVCCILVSLVGIISSLFTLLNERVELNYCWACTNLVYHLKISAWSLLGRTPSLSIFQKKNFLWKHFHEISPKKSRNFLVRELYERLDNSLNGLQILNNLSKVSHSNPSKSVEIFKQLIL